MIRNYFKIAWRNLLKNRGFSLINIAGLGIGITACILIALFIRHEASYEKHVPNADNLYRLVGAYVNEGKLMKGVHFSANMGSTLEQDFAEVRESGRMMDNPLFNRAGTNEIRIAGEVMQRHEEGFTYADQSILDMMGVQMVRGDVASALANPFTIVISERKAKKLFGSVDKALDQTIYFNGQDNFPYKVNGVMENFPTNSHFEEYDFLVTLSGIEFGEGEQTRWLQNNYFVYLDITPGVEIKTLEEKFTNQILDEYMIPAMKDAQIADAEKFRDAMHLELQPISDIHLRSTDIMDTKTRGDYRFVWLFGAISLFILLIACVNFINLSTAKSANRAKEVGLRKVVGSGRKTLVIQFLTESVLMTMIAFVLGLGLAALSLPYFNRIADVSLTIPWTTWWFLPILILAAIMVGIISGIYPAFYLSGFRPIDVLRGKVRRGSKSSGLRGGLVVFQFAIAMILIVSTLTVNQQMKYILTKKVGYQKEQVIQIYGTSMLGEQDQAFKAELETLSGVSSVSISDYLPIDGTKRNGNTFYNEGKDQTDRGLPGQAWIIDEDYLETMEMNLIAGRNYDAERGEEDQKVIINEKMVEKLNMSEPIGKNLSRFNTLYEIIGVVEDFNYEALSYEVRPLAMFYGNSNSIISVKANTEDMNALLTRIEGKWQAFAPNLAFRYSFMDDEYAEMYAYVQRIGTLFTNFAFLAILIACLGLFTLSAFMAEQRGKEISIRKVLGANASAMVGLLSKDFLKPVLLALILGSPLAYYAMDQWLQDFAYSQGVQWWVFLLAGMIALLIAFLTISVQSIKAAISDPIHALRNE
ncbi:MAG: ABC transporter permease [Bacteroidota bacterium]